VYALLLLEKKYVILHLEKDDTLTQKSDNEEY